jgi:hypothetical protein
MRSFHHFILFTLTSTPSANSFSKDDYCLDAIYEAYSDMTFVGNNNKEYWLSTCTNPLHLISMYASGITYCTQHELSSGTALLARYCKKYGGVSLTPMFELKENLTARYIKTLPIVNDKDGLVAKNITTPVLLSEAYYATIYHTRVSKIHLVYVEILIKSFRPPGSLKNGVTMPTVSPCTASGESSLQSP